MTQLLEQALTKVRQLPPSEQDAIAAIILDELDDEQRWEQAFGSSQEELARLAKRVREDIRFGRVHDKEVDEL
jgi:hypothetical protein